MNQKPANRGLPAVIEAHRLANLIPNFPHPERAKAIHAWAVALKKALHGGYAR